MLPWQRRRIDMFADLLDGRLAPEAAPRKLLAMTGLVGALGAIPAPATPSGLTAGTAALVAHAGAASVPGSAAAGTVAAGTVTKAAVVATKLSLPAWLPTVTGLATATAAISGIAVATTQAKPGDLFYGLKKSVESAQVATANSPADAARERLAQAGTRMTELQALVAGLPAHPSAAQLADVHAVVQSWASLVTASVPALTTTVANATQLTHFLTDQAVKLSQLPQSLPATDLSTISGALRVASTAVSTVKGLLPSVTVPSVVVPTAPVPVIPVLPGHPSSAAPTTSAPTTAPAPTGTTPTTATVTTTPGGTTLVPSNPVTGPVTVPPVTLPTAIPTLPVPTAVPSLVTGLLNGVLGQPRS